jgi:hypothetical protein
MHIYIYIYVYIYIVVLLIYLTSIAIVFHHVFTDLVISDDDLKQFCLIDIDKFLRLNGKELGEYDCMPKILNPSPVIFNNVLLANELSYDHDEMFAKHEEHFKLLNGDQLSAYEKNCKCC